MVKKTEYFLNDIGVKGIVANNATGAPGEVLASNGSSTYWTSPSSGATGYTGSRGTTGFVGSAGANGVNGFTGSAGTNGFTGSKGDIGFTGSQGTTGFVGSRGLISYEDNRIISPSEGVASSIGYGFTSWNNDNNVPYADFLHMRGYVDGSGGLDNLIAFRKDDFGIRQWMQVSGSATPYASYMDVVLANSTGDSTVTGSFRAPIFYDSQNTAFYIDPTGSTSFNGAGNILTNGNLVLGNGSDKLVRIGSSTNYFYDLKSVGDNFQIIEGGTTPRLTVRYPNGNVGIGTTTPETKFVVSNGGGFGLEINPNGGIGGGPYIQAFDRTAGTYQQVTNYASAQTWYTGTGQRAMDLGTDGNLAIGTTATGAGRLTVSGGNGIIINNNGANGYNGMQAINDSGITYSTGVSGSTAAGWTTNRANIGTVSNHPFFIGTNSTLRMTVAAAGDITASVDFRAPIFYDSNNTGYYTDPNGASRMASIQLDQTPYTSDVTALTNAPIQLAGTYNIGVTNTWMPMTHQRAVYTDGYVTHLNTGLYKALPAWGINSSAWYAAIGGADAGPTEAWYLTYGGLINHTNGYVSTANSFRAPLFYDRDNTAYYLDPSAGSRMQSVTWDGGSGVASNGDITARRSSGTTGVLYFGNGVPYLFWDGGAYTFQGSGPVIASGTSFRAPVFYDSDNTAMYMDPNGTSNLQGLTVSSIITANISGYATYLPTRYDSGVISNPQQYFGSTIGLRVAMTGLPVTWADTLWINGYAGGDVPNMCALHFSRQGTPRMWISTQSNLSTAYGTYYEFPIYGYNSAGSTGGLYAGNYYDGQNTGYYADPAGNSNFDRLTIRKSGVSLGSGNSSQLEINNAASGACNISFHREGAYGAHFGLDTDNVFSTMGWSAGNAGYTAMRVGAFESLGGRPLSYTPSGGSLIIKGDGGGWGTGLYFQGSAGTTFGGFGALGSADTFSYWFVGTDFTTSAMRFYAGGAGYAEALVSLRAPIFYDNNNTAYYTDPASTSVMNIIQLANGAQINQNTTTSFCAYRLDGPSRGGYFGHNLGGVTSAFHPVMWDSAGNGGAYFETGGIWVNYYNKANNCTGFGTSTTNAAFNVYCPTGIYSGGRNDGTIFYDSNDTGYYTDPNGTARLNIVVPNQLRRAAHNNGHMEGGYNNIGASESQTSPIYTIGSSYSPAATTLSSMYGIGFTSGGSFFPSGGSGWGLYVAGNGVARIHLGGDNGNITAVGNITAYASDRRLKTNITPISNAMDKLMQIRGVEFDWVDNIEELGFIPQSMHETGVIAQEIQAVVPDAVVIAPFNNHATDLAGYDSEYLTVDKEKIIPLLIEAIKEQQLHINRLEEKINQMGINT